MNSLLTLAQDFEKKLKAHQMGTETMLKAAFSEHMKSVKQELNASIERINNVISDYEKEMASATSRSRKSMLRIASQTWLTIVLTGTMLIALCGVILKWQGNQLLDRHIAIQEQEKTLAIQAEKGGNIQWSICGEKRRLCLKIDGSAGSFGGKANYMIPQGY